MSRLHEPGSLLVVLLVLAAGASARPARALDKVRAETGTDRAVADFDKKGRNVLVGIIDRGIDYTLNDFRNPDGSTRVEYLLDLTDDSGQAIDAPWGGKIGTLYNKAQIQAAISSGTRLAGWDNLGHGTSTASIAAGNGRDSPNGGPSDYQYRGIAPEASFIIVKIEAGVSAYTDPVTGDPVNPEPTAFFEPRRVPEAIKWVAQMAGPAGLNKPAVILLNIGSQGGPTDGHSDLARTIEATVGASKPGIVFVTGPGDDGGQDNRARGTVIAGQTLVLKVRKGDSRPLYFDLWYPEADRFSVRVVTPGGTEPPVGMPPHAAPASRTAETSTSLGGQFALYHRGADITYHGAHPTRRELRIDFTAAAAGDYQIELTGATIAGGGVFDATLGFSQFWNDYRTNRFLNHLTPGSIWDGAAAPSNICPGDYVLRNTWVDEAQTLRPLVVPGAPFSDPDFLLHGDIGRIWEGSSTGPTFDGRNGVDIVAPGDHVFTRYAPHSLWAVNRGYLILDGGGKYGKASAVSASAPIVTGIVALMLERNPQLDAVTLKGILQRTARWDLPTPRPNPVYGWGKVDARATLAEAFATNLVVNDTANAAGWAIQSDLQEWSQSQPQQRRRPFGGRVSRWSQVPAALRGKDWIRTSARSRLYSGTTLATFQVNAPSTTVYVCRPVVGPTPSWLLTWTASGHTLVESSDAGPDVSMPCLRRVFARNATVSLGRNSTSGDPEIGMYTVVIGKP